MKIKMKSKIMITLIFMLFFLVLYLFLTKKENDKKNICRGYLTDNEYLKHMIPHHQVAVDISILLQKKSKNPRMQEILRKIIWVQNYEIREMKDMLKDKPNNEMSYDKAEMNRNEIITRGTITSPNKVGLTKTYCDPHFFDPEKHMEHMKHMKLTDKMYIHHMIPHHQVAVDMSKVLLKNTKNDYMIYLATRIIRSQEEEIILLNDMLRKERYNNKSNLLK
tara:strand:+ start:396 stop:1058 length:663 start_codon:yes stop_codon:yes gene_type:complete